MNDLIKKGLLLVTVAICTSFSSTPDMRAVEILNHWEIPINGKVQPFQNVLTLIYSNECRILKQPYGVAASNSNGKIPPDGYRYFIAKNGDRFGLVFSSITRERGRKYAVDSLINDYLSTPSTFYSLKTVSKDSVKVIRDLQKGITLEKITNSKTTALDQDSCYFYYRDKKIALPFYNKSIRCKGLFLYKSKVIFNEHKKGTLATDISVGRRELVFEIKQCDVPDQEQLTKLVERFNQQVNQLY